jgi:phage terminase small subunit
MTERQQRFVLEYVKDGNATQAAIRAGFSPNGASVQATRLLGNASIATEIANLRAPIIEEAGITLATHLKELADLRDGAIEAGQYGPAVTAAISRGKAAGLYTERVEHSGEIDMLAFRRRSAN